MFIISKFDVPADDHQANLLEFEMRKGKDRVLEASDEVEALPNLIIRDWRTNRGITK